MVCDRCIYAVDKVMADAGISANVSLGEVETPIELTNEQLGSLKTELEHLGFEILDDKRTKLVEKIKAVIIRTIHHPGERTFNLSVLIAEELKYEYKYLSSLFSSLEGVTIEKYYIRQKIERAKELIAYNELSLSQIADELGYGNVAHLSNQFKTIVGITPSQFKLNHLGRSPLDKV